MTEPLSTVKPLSSSQICHECDLPIRLVDLNENQKAICPRCGFTLATKYSNAFTRIIALSITALIFLVASVSFNFISFQSSGLVNSISMLDSVSILITTGFTVLAIIEIITVFVIPVVILLSLIYLSYCFKNNRHPWQGHTLLQLVFTLIPWNMAEIFLVGTLVSLIKIISLAEITLGPSFYAFILFSIAMTSAILHIDKHHFYQMLAKTSQNQIEHEQNHPVNPSAAIQRTWALIITSIILYIPANVLPIMNTRLLGQNDPSTIIGGVLLLWHHKSYPIALVIFVASIMVPIAKILVLIWLNYSVQTRSNKYDKQRIKMYRIAEFVGRWSMIDIFVVIILASLVQLGNTMSIVPGSATFAFSGVVVVTMLAAMSFEPKLIYNDKSVYEN